MLDWNQEAGTLECLDSLAEITYPNFTIFLVDNGSTDGSAEAISQWTGNGRQVELIRIEPNLGFIGGSNVGIRPRPEPGTKFRRPASPAEPAPLFRPTTISATIFSPCLATAGLASLSNWNWW